MVCARVSASEAASGSWATSTEMAMFIAGSHPDRVMFRQNHHLNSEQARTKMEAAAQTRNFNVKSRRRRRACLQNGTRRAAERSPWLRRLNQRDADRRRPAVGTDYADPEDFQPPWNRFGGVHGPAKRVHAPFPISLPSSRISRPSRRSPCFRGTPRCPRRRLRGRGRRP